ncbi:hypothetical protein K7X08_029084 [Anisodus acutangulus]|uniref:Uncharacterized protein n=1 Tax=Anisodus acutangulus TaxID=402998 RepID=A0A9Q1QTF8_9SOLA|nr:hypothetical protein K7X08_029084 [Anisodus acutangulus]
MDLQSETITASVIQGVLSEAEQHPNDTLVADTQAFIETPSVVVVEPLLDAERGVPEEVGADEVVVVGAAEDEKEIAATQDDQAVIDSANPETSITDDVA